MAALVIFCRSAFRALFWTKRDIASYKRFGPSSLSILQVQRAEADMIRSLSELRPAITAQENGRRSEALLGTR